MFVFDLVLIPKSDGTINCQYSLKFINDDIEFLYMETALTYPVQKFVYNDIVSPEKTTEASGEFGFRCDEQLVFTTRYGTGTQILRFKPNIETEESFNTALYTWILFQQHLLAGHHPEEFQW